MPLARGLQRFPFRNVSTDGSRPHGSSKLIVRKQNHVAGCITRNQD